MSQLHELIAVEDEAKKTLAKILEEAKDTFNKRVDHFDEMSKTYEANDEKDTDIPDTEQTTMVTTVIDKLNYVKPYIIKQLDIILQKESANTKALADIIIDLPDGSEMIMGKDVPVLVLVQYESLLENMRRTVYDNIPTLDPKTDWILDPTRKNVWTQKNPTEKKRTKKLPKPVVLAPATDKHPAQVQVFMEDLPVGKYTIKSSTGRLSPAQKSELLDLLDRVIAGIKKARARANTTQVEKKSLGKVIFDFIKLSDKKEVK